jgi:hypothetical protein
MPKPDRRRKWTILKGGRRWAAACLGVFLGASSWVALASVGGEPSSPGAQASAVAPGPERLVRAYGFAASSGQRAFELQDGDTVSVFAGVKGRCFVRTLGGQPAGEACSSRSDVAAGQAITVSDECGTSGSGRLELVGLAPDGATTVRLRYSDGTTTETSVLSGAFRFEGNNPKPRAPYPNGVEWLDSGSPSGTAGLPVNGDEFCPPTS